MGTSVIAAVFVVVLDVYVGARYGIRLIRKEIAPRLVTWLIFEIGVVMSLVAYFTSHDHNLLKAALNITDGVMVTIILATILIQQREQRHCFTSNERLCLMIACLATACWIVTRNRWIGLLGFQLVMSIAYVPTIESVWRWKPERCPEPLDKWSINTVIALIGGVVDIADGRDYLALVYPLRALILCVIVILLILRWKRKKNVELVRA